MDELPRAGKALRDDSHRSHLLVGFLSCVIRGSRTDVTVAGPLPPAPTVFPHGVRGASPRPAPASAACPIRTRPGPGRPLLSRGMNTPRLDLIGLVVSDMAASLAFYRRLGLDVPEGAGSAPHVEAVLPGGLRVAWDTEETVRSFDPAWSRPAGGHRVELAFRCGSPEEVDALYAELTGAGYGGHLPPWDAVWGQRYAVVLDPDGAGVSLFADLDTAPAVPSAGDDAGSANERA